MRRWAITITYVSVVTAETQAAAVIQFEREHPGQGGLIVKVEEIVKPEQARPAEARARRDED